MLTGLAEVVHVTYREEPSWLVAVRFRFDEGYLQVEVDPDDDTVDVSFDGQHWPPLRHWAADSVSRQVNQSYAGLVGQSSCSWWVLRNQQQYEDGFQIELGASASVTTTFQYLALASRLSVRQVGDAPTP